MKYFDFKSKRYSFKLESLLKLKILKAKYDSQYISQNISKKMENSILFSCLVECNIGLLEWNLNWTP